MPITRMSFRRDRPQLQQSRSGVRRRRPNSNVRAAFDALEDRRMLAGGMLNDPPVAPPPDTMVEAASQAAPTYQRPAAELFNPGDGGYPAFYSPTIVRTNSGALIVIAEARQSQGFDTSAIALVMRRSIDGGLTWSPVEAVYSAPYINVGVPVVDQATGAVIFLFTRLASTSVWSMRSDDEGLTWSTPTDITASVKVTGPDSPAGHTFPQSPWGWVAIGPGHGIQLQHGAHAGRLMIAADHRLSSDTSGPSWTHVIFSDDHGQTWQLGGGLKELSYPGNTYSNESTVVERNNGDLYLSIRVVNGNFGRYYSRSTDGGMTWSDMAYEPVMTTPSVEGTILRVNDNLVLFAAPDAMGVNDIRRQMTIWASYDDTLTWVKKKAVFFGPSGYSDMALAAPDTIVLVYNRGHAAGVTSFADKIGIARFDLQWLESPDPYEFNWYFNEGQAGSPANITGTSIQDYSIWDNRAQARTSDAPPIYVDGAHGDTALQLTSGSDNVLLTPAKSQAAQFSASESFTVQVVLKTTATTGVILGTLPTVANWTLDIVNGRLRFSLYDTVFNPKIVSDNVINDGEWHTLAAVRDATSHQLRLYVDRLPAATPIVDSTRYNLRTNEEVTLGEFNDGSGQWAGTIDTLRLTRAVVSQTDFLPADFVSPLPMPGPTYGNDAPSAIPGVQLWFPRYDPTSYFADFGFADPLLLVPRVDDAIHSAVDLSGNGWHATAPSNSRYDYDNAMGPHWLMDPVTVAAGASWRVLNSDGTHSNNFDFVQNTGVFTLSAFIKPSSEMVGQTGFSALFDTNEAVTIKPGFSLILNADGRLAMLITAADGATRFPLSGPDVSVSFDHWYHVAVVGSGPGSPLLFYITPIDANAVQSYATTNALSGADGLFPTDAAHDLQIGGRSNSMGAAFFGGMVDAAVFNRSLTAAEIQQLFAYEKRPVAPLAHLPMVLSNASTVEEFQTTAGLVIDRNPQDGPDVTHFKITGITGGTLFQHDGVTPISNGDFITVAQGNAGLKFTPAPDITITGHFTAQSAQGADDTGLSFNGVAASVFITPVNDPPSFVAGPDQIVPENAGAQIILNWATAITAGPTDEANQTLAFHVTNNNPALFLAPPLIQRDGTLKFATDPEISGTATVTVVLFDDGGLLNAGQNASPPLTFLITHYVLHEPLVNNAVTPEDVPYTSLVISRNPLDGPEVTRFKITGITAGTLYQNGGIVPIQDGEFITAAQASAGLTFVPPLNSIQSGYFNVQSASDSTESGAGLATRSVQVAITPVNDPPLLTTGGDIEISETSGPQTFNGWATAIACGPPNEAGQTLTIQLTSDNPAMFSVQPTISPDGTLSFAGAPDQNGTATVTIVIKDNGGTAQGGSDTSLRTFHITIHAVNDPPTFVKGGDQFTESFAGAQIVSGWAGNVSPGPLNESSQQVDFIVSNNNPGLFSQQPAIAADGTLSYTPATGANGNALVTVALHDDGGVALGGSNTSASQTFHIDIGPVYHVQGDSLPNQNDVIRIVRRQAFFDVYINNNSTTPTASQPIAAWTTISVNALGGNDSLIVDYSGGNPIPAGGLAYDGGSGTDSLAILGSGGQNGLYVPSLNASNEGFVAVDDLQQSFTSVESLTMSALSNLTVLSAASNGSLAFDSPSAGQNRLSNAVIPALTFFNTGLLTLDTTGRPATAAADNVTISSAGLVGAASLHFNSGGGLDSLTTNGGSVNAVLSPAGQLDLTVNSGVVSLGQSVALHTLSLTAGGLLSISGIDTQVSSTGLAVSGGATIDVSSSNLANLGSNFTTLSAGSQLTKTGNGSMFLGGTQNPGPGATLNANAGTTMFVSDGGWNLSVRANAAVTFGATQHLTAVDIGQGAVAAIAGAGTVLVTESLTIDPAGTLDVGECGLIVTSDSVNSSAVEAAIQNYLRSGFHAGDWNGHGITSSSLGVIRHEIVTLGINRNFVYQSFMGQPVDTNSILVRYTYAGDADLSGVIDGTDFALIDNGYNFGKSSWHDGDVDFNGVIDGTDFAYIDNAYNLQPGPLSTGLAAAVAPLSSSQAIADPVPMPLASSSTAPVPVSIPALDSPAQSLQSLDARALARIFAADGSQPTIAEPGVTQRRRTQVDIALLDDALLDPLAFDIQ